MKIRIIYVLSFFFIIFILIFLYDLKNMPIQNLILCANGSPGFVAPSSVCRSYLFQFRGDEEDILYLNNYNGISAILNSTYNENKYEIADFLISKGIDVNQIVKYTGKDMTPLHMSVLLNDVSSVKFLLNNGADKTIKSESYDEMTPFQLAKRLQNKMPSPDRGEIINVLSD